MKDKFNYKEFNGWVFTCSRCTTKTYKSAQDLLAPTKNGSRIFCSYCKRWFHIKMEDKIIL